MLKHPRAYQALVALHLQVFSTSWRFIPGRIWTALFHAANIYRLRFSEYYLQSAVPQFPRVHPPTLLAPVFTGSLNLEVLG